MVLLYQPLWPLPVSLTVFERKVCMGFHSYLVPLSFQVALEYENMDWYRGFPHAFHLHRKQQTIDHVIWVTWTNHTVLICCAVAMTDPLILSVTITWSFVCSIACIIVEWCSLSHWLDRVENDCLYKASNDWLGSRINAPCLSSLVLVHIYCTLPHGCKHTCTRARTHTNTNINYTHTHTHTHTPHLFP